MTDRKPPKADDPSSDTPFFAALRTPMGEVDAVASEVAWADGRSAGAAVLSDAAGPDALEAFERARRGRAVHLKDPLLESLWLEGLYLAAGRDAPDMRDWMLALAPFEQARDLAAILRAAAPRAPAEETAAEARVMAEVWREAKKRSQV